MMMANVLDRESTAEEALGKIDLSGKVVVITGATAGLGEESARVMAGAGAHVVITGRSQEKLAAVVERLRANSPDARVDTVMLELAEPESVRAAARRILEIAPRIDILINNAGVMAPPLERNSLGWESQFAGNHMGHFILTGILLPAIVAAAPSRIVNLSSSGHQIAPVNFDDPHFEHQDYDAFIAYGQSKSANILFTVALADKLKDRGVTVNAVMPGVVKTPLFRHIGGTGTIGSSGMFVKEIPQGAATQVWAAVSPDLEGVTGRYLEDCGFAPVNDDPASVATFGYRSAAMDKAAAARLWSLSEELAGERFDT
ncbi:NAD(P)-dependent dehydrogenase (short-subunit alcohol dehydrogenase family) [Sphingobium wenxiniae]|nr:MULTISPECIES: SDR family NAD(P)-dependent oxidoreductase [Sphingobium]MBB6191724.1 NAD(P)-dependent dehydrogenase (short-subunit alcohol dehydrogenase family) [Sphingobium wenxiniae]WRD76442.1 SDR family NAD(P)-dependent oxidoreductase [Sphingobium baderi]